MFNRKSDIKQMVCKMKVIVSVKTCLLLSLFGLTMELKAQQVLVSEMYPELKYYPLKGQVYYQDYIQVKGSAFLKGENWMKGDLILTSGERMNDINFKFDIYAHRVLVYHEFLKRVVSISKKDLTEFYIKDSGSQRRFIFLSEISTKASVSHGCYVEVLSEGRLSFYKLYYKDVLPLRTPVMPLLDEFLDESTYYLKDGDKMNSFRLNKKSLIKLYPQYKSEIKQFVRKKNLHLRNQSDFVIAVSHLGRVLELIENNQ